MRPWQLERAPDNLGRIVAEWRQHYRGRQLAEVRHARNLSDALLLPATNSLLSSVAGHWPGHQPDGVGALAVALAHAGAHARDYGSFFTDWGALVPSQQRFGADVKRDSIHYNRCLRLVWASDWQEFSNSMITGIRTHIRYHGQVPARSMVDVVFSRAATWSEPSRADDFGRGALMAFVASW